MITIGDRKVLAVAGVSPPDKRKFEEDVKVIVETINGLEEKIVSFLSLGLRNQGIHVISLH